jgi:hypothetical protein
MFELALESSTPVDDVFAFAAATSLPGLVRGDINEHALPLLTDSMKFELATWSCRALAEIRRTGDPATLFQFCQRNAHCIAPIVKRLLALNAVPLRAVGIVGEVLAETVDLVCTSHFVIPEAAYTSIPLRCRDVIQRVCDELLGFVPMSPESGWGAPLVASLARSIEVPASIAGGFSTGLEGELHQIVLAQSMLNLSRSDRLVLTRTHGSVAESPDSSDALIDLLSACSVRTRYCAEIRRATHWSTRPGTRSTGAATRAGRQHQ